MLSMIVASMGIIHVVSQSDCDYESVYRTLYNRRALYYPALPQSKLAIKDAITSNSNWKYNYHGFRRRQFELHKKHQVGAERFNYKSEEKLDEDVGVIQQTVNKLKRRLCKLKEIKSISFGASIADESILYLGCDDRASFQVFGDRFAYQDLS